MILSLLPLLLAAWLISGRQACTYTADEWLLVACPNNATYTLCDTDWCSLLAINVVGMLRAENRLWVLAAQQYAAAYYNAMQDGFVDQTGELDQALLYVGGTLEMACGNVSQWQLTDSLAQALAVLYETNHGNQSCPPLTPGSQNDTFYYTQPPYLMTLRDGVSNMTTSYSALANIYGTQQFLVSVAILEFVAIALLVLKWVQHRNERRQYMWMLRNANPCVEPGIAQNGGGDPGEDGGVELSSMEEEDLGGPREQLNVQERQAI